MKNLKNRLGKAQNVTVDPISTTNADTNIAADNKTRIPSGDLIERASAIAAFVTASLFCIWFGYVRSCWGEYGFSGEFAWRLIFSMIALLPFAYADDFWNRIVVGKMSKICPRYKIKSRDIFELCDQCLPLIFGKTWRLVAGIAAIALGIFMIASVFIIIWSDMMMFYAYMACFTPCFCLACMVCIRVLRDFCITRRAIKYLQ